MTQWTLTVGNAAASATAEELLKEYKACESPDYITYVRPFVFPVMARSLARDTESGYAFLGPPGLRRRRPCSVMAIDGGRSGVGRSWGVVSGCLARVAYLYYGRPRT